jgi:hypothetical protein
VKSKPLARLLLFLICSAATSSISSAQTPAPHQLTLIHPDDRVFDQLLNTNFPGLDRLDGYPAFRPFLVLLRNDTSHAVRAYML